MPQLVRGTSFVAESPDELGITAQLDGQKFQSDLSAEQRVFGQIDDAHSALAQLAQDAIFVAHDMAGLELPRLDQDSTSVGQVACWSGYGVSQTGQVFIGLSHLDRAITGGSAWQKHSTVSQLLWIGYECSLIHAESATGTLCVVWPGKADCWSLRTLLNFSRVWLNHPPMD